jgi:hypothetical protein
MVELDLVLAESAGQIPLHLRVLLGLGLVGLERLICQELDN